MDHAINGDVEIGETHLSIFCFDRIQHHQQQTTTADALSTADNNSRAETTAYIPFSTTTRVIVQNEIKSFLYFFLFSFLFPLSLFLFSLHSFVIS